MDISKKHLEEFKKIFEKKYGKKLTDDEAYDSISGLVRLVELAFDHCQEEERRKQRLKKEPKGFSLEGSSYTCPICSRTVPANEMWYDKHGQKCLICQKAINKRIIPGMICEKSDLWYSMWELESNFKLKSPTVRKLVRQNILKARIIPDINVYIFLIKDNADTLPPKDLVKSRVIRVGENTIKSQDWYEFKDPKETLKNYKIWSHLTAFK